MAYKLTTSIEPEFVRVTVFGDLTVDEGFGLIERLFDETQRTPLRKLLVDATQYVGQMTEIDRFNSGRRFAEVFGPRIKTAFIFSPDQITKMGEIAAANRGATILVTPSEDMAVEWLLN